MRKALLAEALEVAADQWGAGLLVAGATIAVGALAKPLVTVNGETVKFERCLDYQNDGNSAVVTELSPEIFDLHETVLKDIRNDENPVGNYGKLSRLINTLHIVDVSTIDPNQWQFDRRGWTRPESQVTSHRLDMIPVASMRNQAIDTYMRCKFFNITDYSHVTRTNMGVVLRFRRLVLPILEKGFVTRLLVAIAEERPKLQEKIIGRIVPGNVRQPEVGWRTADRECADGGDAIPGECEVFRGCFNIRP